MNRLVRTGQWVAYRLNRALSESTLEEDGVGRAEGELVLFYLMLLNRWSKWQQLFT